MDKAVLLIGAIITSLLFICQALVTFCDFLPLRMWVDAYWFSERLKPGNVYYYEERDKNDPFAPIACRRVEIIDVKKNDKGVLWVKYQQNNIGIHISEAAIDLYRYKIRYKCTQGIKI